MSFNQRMQFGIGPSMTPAVKYLIFANIGIFILEHLMERLGFGFIMFFGLVPSAFLHDFYIWQVVTYTFLHDTGGILHILLNMLMLWIFGSDVERGWGSKAFLKYYFICGIGAGLIQVLFNIIFAPEFSNVPIIGASGAIYGVLLAFALMFPDRELTFLLFFVMPVRIQAKYLAMILAGISLISGLFGADNAVAHFAHLGGMLVGLIYLKLDWHLQSVSSFIQKKRETREVIRKAKKRQHEEQIRADVDAILDKINEVGYENLTPEEQEILKRASQYLNEESS